MISPIPADPSNPDIKANRSSESDVYSDYYFNTYLYIMSITMRH